MTAVSVNSVNSTMSQISQILKMDFMSKYVDVVVVEKVGINIRRGPVEKMSTADGENLAHGIASMKKCLTLKNVG